MKKLLTITWIIILVAVIGCSDSSNDSYAQNKNKSTDKAGVVKVADKNFTLSFNQGLEKASKEQKNMIVDFFTDWCHWCKVMDEKTFHDSTVAKKLSDRFVTVRLNAEDPNSTVQFKGETFTNVELTREFKVTGFPSLAFISPEKEIITIIPGYIPAEKFIYILDYIDKECYKKQVSFEEFMKRKGDCDESKDATKSF